jgi:hypothetical protein
MTVNLTARCPAKQDMNVMHGNSNVWQYVSTVFILFYQLNLINFTAEVEKMYLCLDLKSVRLKLCYFPGSY